MALTNLQRTVCQLLAARRIESGESYIAGGAALNAILGSSRISHDLDLFHSTEEALQRSSEADQQMLIAAGFHLEPLRELRSFVEVMARSEGSEVIVQWVRDSAFRFFPLLWHPELGLTLHPLELATNKVLALVGCVEVRD